MGCQSVPGPKWVTLSDLEQPSDCCIALFHAIEQLLEPIVSNLLKPDTYCRGQKCCPGSLVMVFGVVDAISVAAELPVA